MRSKRVGSGVSQKLTFAHKGGVGAGLWKGAKFTLAILEHLQICYQPKSYSPNSSPSPDSVKLFKIVSYS